MIHEMVGLLCAMLIIGMVRTFVSYDFLGIARAPLYERYAAPTPLFSLAWNEDIDLSGGAAAIATTTKMIPDFRDGTDDFILPYDCWLKRILYCDETVGGAGALLVSDKPLGKSQSTTIWRQNALTIGDNTILCHEFPGHGLFLPENTKLSMTGAASGAAAEQHTCVIDLHSSHFNPKVDVGSEIGELIQFHLKTGTLVANQLTGENDILGHTNAFEDSEPSLPVDATRRYTLLGIVVAPGLAGVGLCGFKHQKGECYFLRPTIFASAVTGYYFPLDQPWSFQGGYKGAPRLVGAGAVTTSTEFQPIFVQH